MDTIAVEQLKYIHNLLERMSVRQEETNRKLDRIIELLEKLQPQESNWQRKNLEIDGKWYTFNWNSNEPTQCYYEVLVSDNRD